MIGSTRSLDGVDKLELWHDDTGIGNGWFADYVAVTDNKTSEEACFFIGQYLNKENGGIEDKHLILDKQSKDNRPCREHRFDGNESTVQETGILGNPSSAFKQTYRIETKTGIKEHVIWPKPIICHVHRSHWPFRFGWSWYKCIRIYSYS
jgi:hypothetical protein